MRDMIEKRGAIPTAKHFLDLNKVTDIQYGLDALAESDLLDCTIEQAAIDFARLRRILRFGIAVAKSKLKIVAKKK